MRDRLARAGCRLENSGIRFTSQQITVPEALTQEAMRQLLEGTQMVWATGQLDH